MSQCCRSMDHLVIGPALVFALRCVAGQGTAESAIRCAFGLWGHLRDVSASAGSWLCFEGLWGRPNSFPSFPKFLCLFDCILIYLDISWLHEVSTEASAILRCCLQFLVESMWNPCGIQSHQPREVKKNDPNTPGKKIDDYWETSQKAWQLPAAALFFVAPGGLRGRTRDLEGPRFVVSGDLSGEFGDVWCLAQEILQDPKALLDRLFNFDKDNIPDRVIQAKRRGHIEPSRPVKIWCSNVFIHCWYSFRPLSTYNLAGNHALYGKRRFRSCSYQKGTVLSDSPRCRVIRSRTARCFDQNWGLSRVWSPLPVGGRHVQVSLCGQGSLRDRFYLHCTHGAVEC